VVVVVDEVKGDACWNVEEEDSFEMGVVEYKNADDVVEEVEGGEEGGDERGCCSEGIVELDLNSEGGDVDAISNRCR